MRKAPKTQRAYEFLCSPEPNQEWVDLHVDLEWRPGYRGCSVHLYYVESERQAGFRRQLRRDDFVPPSQAVLGERPPAHGRLLYELAAHSPYSVALDIVPESSIEAPPWLRRAGYQPLPRPDTIGYSFINVLGEPTRSMYFPNRVRDLVLAERKLSTLLARLRDDPKAAAIYDHKLDEITQAQQRLHELVSRRHPHERIADGDLEGAALRFCIEPFTVDSAEAWRSWCEADPQHRPVRQGRTRDILTNSDGRSFYFATVIRRDPDSVLADALGIAAAYLADPKGSATGGSGRDQL